MSGDMASFGEVLRRLRDDAALSQKELAERAGLSVRGISDLERGARRIPHLQTIRLLAEALGASDRDRARLLDAARPARRGGAAAHRPPRLPHPLTRLVGREAPLAALRALLGRDDVRLVTLTGAAGIGKTRLAIALAEEMAGAFADGVVFVDLAPLRDADTVLPTIAAALEVRETGATPLAQLVHAALAPRQFLLLCDNFEHLIPAAPLLTALLQGAPGVKALVTSRQPLHVRGEREFPVPTLELPDSPAQASAETVVTSEAVTLFVERAQDARFDFALTAESAPAVAQIVIRLDGLPLAIELAAAGVRVLAPRAILRRLEHRFDLLTGGPRDAPNRHRTMRDAISWSHDLLNDSERAVFRRLAVFAGGFTLEAAKWVTGSQGGRVTGRDGRDGRDAAVQPPTPRHPDTPTPPSDTLDLNVLVDHGLVRQEEHGNGEPRFSMLETIHAYALERLHASGEADAIQRRHAAWLIAFAETVLPCLKRTAQAAELERMAPEIDNVRAALTWALAHGEPVMALRLATATFQLWFLGAMPSEGRHWLESSLTAAPDAPARLRTDALICASALAFLQGDVTRHVALAEESLAVARDCGYQFGIAMALFELGVAAEGRHDLDDAAARYEEALGLMRGLDEPYWIALLLSNLGDVNLWRGEIASAAALATEGLARWREIGSDWGIAQGLGTVAAVASAHGDAARAATLYGESLGHSVALGDRRGIAGTLAGLADLAGAAGQPRQAARLLGAAQAVAGASDVRHLAHHDQYERILATTRARLDDRAFTDAWASGQALSLDQALAEADAVVGFVATSRPVIAAAETDAAPANVVVLRTSSRRSHRA